MPSDNSVTLSNCKRLQEMHQWTIVVLQEAKVLETIEQKMQERPLEVIQHAKADEQPSGD